MRLEGAAVGQAAFGGDREDRRLPGVARRRARSAAIGVGERAEVAALLVVELGGRGRQRVVADDDDARRSGA